MQDDFYDNVINDKDSKHRYFAILDRNNIDIEKVKTSKEFNTWLGGNKLIGMGGLNNIEWENSTAEISLIINPDYRGKGYGMKSVDLLFKEGFSNMGLYSVYGEVYECGNKGFWEKVVDKYDGYKTMLPNRKLHNGIMYDSMWFSVKG